MSLGFALTLAFGLTAATAPDGPLLQTLHSAHVCAQAAAEQALAHTTSDAVKRYATDVRAGHKAADQAVEALATKLGATLAPPTAEDADNEEAGDLGSLQGSLLDRTFLKNAIANHARVVSDLEAARSTISDKLVKKLCDQELRVLRALEAKARKLEEKL